MDSNVDMEEVAKEVVKHMRETNEGRNLKSEDGGRGCFAVRSYGWKDADLDKEGCCGIDKIEADAGMLRVEFSGHKTFCDPSYEFEYDLSEKERESWSECAHGIVCDAPGEGMWSGDDWSFSISGEFLVAPVMKRTSEKVKVAHTLVGIVFGERLKFAAVLGPDKKSLLKNELPKDVLEYIDLQADDCITDLPWEQLKTTLKNWKEAPEVGPNAIAIEFEVERNYNSREIDIPLTCDMINFLAERRISEESDGWAQADESLEELYKEMVKKCEERDKRKEKRKAAKKKTQS